MLAWNYLLKKIPLQPDLLQASKKTEANRIGKLFILFIASLNKQNYEKHTLHFSRYINCWLVIGSICMECRRTDSYSYRFSNHIPFVRHYSQSIAIYLSHIHGPFYQQGYSLYCSHFFITNKTDLEGLRRLFLQIGIR